MGFSISSLFLSLGISISSDTYKRLQDYSSGNPEEQLLGEIVFREKNKENVHAAVGYMREYGDIHIVSLLPIIVQEYSVQPVAIINPGLSDWHIPILSGKYFSGGDKEIIIGREVEFNMMLHVGDTIQINKDTFYVRGVAGRPKRPTQWDNCIFVNWKDYSEAFGDTAIWDRETMSVLLKTGRDRFIEDYDKLAIKFESIGADIFYRNLDNGAEKSSFNNALLTTCISFITILLVTIINTFNLMFYWLYERRKDYALIRSLGVTSAELTKYLAVEIALIYMIGGVLAILLQYFANQIFGNYFAKRDIYMEIDFINIFTALFVSMAVGAMCAILLSKKSFSFEPSELLKEDS